MTQAALPEPQTGDQLILGRYRPIEPLGTGGSGTVWRARDEEQGRDVALKVVDGQGRAALRAQREAAAVARLSHPHCARAYAIERDERHVYLVSEYIHGKTLREALRTQTLSDRDIVEVAAQLLDALAHAHRHGVVHRDVKPTNVMLEEGDSIRTRLLDFGLAVIDDVDSLTATGDVPGTLAYIPPERLDGHEASGATDVWGVGLILWEGLSGRHPFSTKSPVETAALIADGVPPLDRERRDIPKALVAAVESALALAPEKRPEPAALAWTLRSSLARPPRRRGQRVRVARGVLAGRLVHAGSSAVFVAAALTFFPFFPPSFTLPTAAAVAGIAFARPRLGLFFALAIPVFPLGDVSSGLAWAYGIGALAYFAVMAREPSGGLVAVAGPLLAAAGALVLAPLLALPLRGALRRGLVAGLAVLAAVLSTSLYGMPLPFTGAAAPLGLGIPGSESPTAVASALAEFLVAHPAIIAAACTLAVAAVLAPAAIRGSAWPLAFGCAAVLALLVLGPTLAFDASVTTMPTIAYTWLAFAVLVVPVVIRLRRQSQEEQPRPRTAASSHKAPEQPPKTSSPIVSDEPSLANVWAQVVERETAAAQALRSEAAAALRS
ncbi:MAG: serine/threonine-protein kinase [Actinomycetia bacterium]|nr:serine/threonine-protein kinase [Actinomycetes bacterium]